MSYLRATRVLCWLLGIAVLVSVVHYVDNYVNYDDYPVQPADSALPTVTKDLVAIGWFVFADAPSRSTIIGGLVICGSTLWIARRESRGPR